VISGLKPGSIFIDMRTIAPTFGKDWEARTRDACLAILHQ
jgi:3-hydroxyisobutyrate dehydrogenase-like beta-hydroxyacid dehydrogenase